MRKLGRLLWIIISVVMTGLAINLMGDGLRDWLDPKLRLAR